MVLRWYVKYHLYYIIIRLHLYISYYSYISGAYNVYAITNVLCYYISYVGYTFERTQAMT